MIQPRPFPGSEYDLTAACGLTLCQPRKGFRFTHDALLLYSVLTAGASSVLEIGSGCGILSLLYAGKNPESRVTGVDILEVNARLAGYNAQINGLSNVSFLHRDIRLFHPDRLYGLIFSNPPYRRAGTGRLSPSAHKNAALYDSSLDMDALFSAAERLLSPQGAFFMIIWKGRQDEMVMSAGKQGLFPFELTLFKGEKESHHAFVAAGFSRSKGLCRYVVKDKETWAEQARCLMNTDEERKGL